MRNRDENEESDDPKPKARTEEKGGSRSLVHRVRRVLDELVPSGDASVARVAERLEISPRSLQRRLHYAGRAFRSIQREALLAHAQTQLSEPGVRQHDVARALGYASPSSFQRAFKIWSNGSLPSALRS